MQNPTEVKLKLNMLCVASLRVFSLRASSPVWASETALARTRERAAKAQIGELARRLASFKKCSGLLSRPKQHPVLIYGPRILELKSEKSVNRLCLMQNQNVIHLSLKYFTQSFIPKLFCQSSLIPLIVCPVIPYPKKQVNGKHTFTLFYNQKL